jgi:hypothetical protein
MYVVNVFPVVLPNATGTATLRAEAKFKISN